MNEKLHTFIIDALVSDGYVVVENAIEAKLITRLINSIDDTSFKEAGISGGSDLHIDVQRRSDKTLWLDEDSAEQSEYLKFCEELRERLNRELYLGLSYYEAHFAIYEEGGFYEKHLDAFRGSKNRVVTTVLYLNEEWSESDGGELVIYDIDDNEIQKVVPNGGTLVVFLSDKFPHEVLASKSKRHSIAGWYRVDR